MTTKFLDLNQFEIPEHEQVLTFLISQDLKMERIFATLSRIVDTEECLIRPRLYKLVLAFAGFNDVNETDVDFYFTLLEECELRMESDIHSIVIEANMICRQLIERSSDH